MEVVSAEVRPPRRSPDHPNRSESQTGTTVVNKQQSPTLNRTSLLKLILYRILPYFLSAHSSCHDEHVH